ncbi:MAG TPA: four helix bundle protein [Candidatus Saccharimonadales bacterium]|nr:four helix bundle protein [Candidatus Saccharimonadales bacterium]
MKTIVNTPIDLRDRTALFARDVIRFVKPLRANNVAIPITTQLIRSSSSIGANFIEAKNAESRKDFRYKVTLCKKEASETAYWLKLCEEFTDVTELSRLQKECRELILILQKIINTLST